MSNRYITTLSKMLAGLGLPVPTNLRADQILTVDLLDMMAAEVKTITTERQLYLEETESLTGQVAILEGQVDTLEGQVDTLTLQLTDAITLGTADADATTADIAAGKTAYVNGVKLVGTAPTLAELTADADATAADIVVDKTAYVAGVKVVGTLV